MDHIYAVDGRCVVLVHGDDPPDEAAFEGYIGALEDAVTRHGAARMLIYAAGSGGPSAAQRMRALRLRGADLRVSVLSSSRVIRGVVTALNWLVGDLVAAFEVHDVDAAIGALGLEPAERVAVRAMVRRLVKEARLPPLSDARE